MTTEPTLCAMCGAPIVPAGEAWDHVGDPKPRHPAIPVGEWQPAPEFQTATPCPLCGSPETAQDGKKAWCNECDAVGPADAWADASGWRGRVAVMTAENAALVEQVNHLLRDSNAAMDALKERERLYAALGAYHDSDLVSLATTLRARNEALEDTLRQILDYTRAYPVDVFPEPNIERARDALEAAGVSIGALHASWARRVLRGVAQLAESEGDTP